MIAQIDKRIARALGGIRQAFRGVLTLVKSAGAVQLVQVDGLAGEQLQDAELFQHFGFTSNPPAGVMAIVLPIGGKTAHGVVIATEHTTFRKRNLAPGEAAIYDSLGQCVYLTQAGIVIDGAGLPMTIQNTPSVTANTPQFNISGNLNVGQNIVAQGDISDHGNKTMSGMRVTYNGHTHTDPQGGSVGTPSGTM
ncbi:MAG: phage baseplate assembly protein [Sulfuriferula sp.]|nr:phage baseplate assembly protein [Sulfuriferula sp.]